MALEKANVSFQVANGVETKNAPPLVDGTKLLQLQNGVFDKGTLGQIHRRNGYLMTTPVDTSGNTITNGQALAVFNSTELDLIASNEFYAESPTSGRFVPKGPVMPMGVAERAISQNFYNQQNADGAQQSGVGAYAWEDGRGGVWCTVIDETSGTIYVPQIQLLATGSCPKVISNGTLLFIVCSDTVGLLHKFTVSPANPTINPATTGTVLSVIVSPSAIFDISLINGYFALAAQNSGGFVFATLALTTLAVSASVSESSSTITAIAVGAMGNNAAVITAGNGFGYVWVFTIPAATLPAGHSYGPFTTVGSNVANITLLQLTTTKVQVWYQQEPTTTADRVIETFTCTISGTVTTPTVVVRGVGLASQVLSYSGATYLLVSYPSVTDQTYFLINSAGVVLGKFYVTQAGPPSTHSRLPAWQNPSTANYSLAVLELVFIEAINGKAQSVAGVSELMLNLAYQTISTASLGPNLFVASGGMISEYDGAALTEGGFNVPPPPPSVPAFFASNIFFKIIAVADIAGDAQAVTITIPQSPPASGLTDAQMLIPGEWFVLDAAVKPVASPIVIPGANASYIWFQVAGAGSSPGIAGYTGYQVTVGANDSAATITTNLFAVLNTIPTAAGYAFSQQSATTLAMETVNEESPSMPGMDTQFNVNVVDFGSGGSPPSVNINCCPGDLIQPGQQIVLPQAEFGVAGLFFNVDGYTIYPIITAGQQWIEVTVLSTLSAQLVASEIALYTGGFITSAVFGNQVTLTALTNGNITAASVTTTVGAVDKYGYIAVYERIDAQGQLEQSAPSIPLSILLPAFGGSAYVPPVFTFTMATLRLTQKAGVDIALYRTLANGIINGGAFSTGSIYYRCSPIQIPASLYNSTTVDYLTYTDTLSDTLLQTNQTLYTTGGVTDNSSPVAFNQIRTNGDRLWGVSSENTYALWYSSKWGQGNAVSWSSAQIETLEPTGGPGVGIASMDSTLVAFENRQVWTFSGDGPDPTGNGSFAGPTLVSSAVGCRDPGSIVLTPSGLVFKSNKGFWLLDRSFQATQVGLDVYGFNADIVSSGVAVPGNTQIRYLSVAGTTLMLDYQYGQWGTFTNHQGVSAVNYNNTYYYLRANGQIMAENPGSYLDGSVGYPMLIQTAWIKLNQVQGYGRVWKAFLLGNFPNTNPLQLQASYNYLPAIIDTEVWNANAGNTLPVWGADAVWGGSTPWGGVGTGSSVNPSVIQLRYDPNKQLCESIQLTIQDLTPYPSTQTWALNAIDFEVGVRKGGFKIGVPQRVG